MSVVDLAGCIIKIQALLLSIPPGAISDGQKKAQRKKFVHDADALWKVPLLSPDAEYVHFGDIGDIGDSSSSGDVAKLQSLHHALFLLL